MWNNILAQLFEFMPVCLFFINILFKWPEYVWNLRIYSYIAFSLFRDILVAAEQLLLAGTFSQITTLDTIGHLKKSPQVNDLLALQTV